MPAGGLLRKSHGGDAVAFGKKLKELRMAAGLTQVQLAERVGMHKFGIAQLEQGRYEPTWKNVRAICRALGVSCSVFEDDDEPPKRKKESDESIHRMRVLDFKPFSSSHFVRVSASTTVTTILTPATPAPARPAP